MIVEDDEDVVEIGSAQGFTQLVEPKKEKADPTSTMPHASKGHGVGGGASRGRPPWGGSWGCVIIPPTVEDLGDEDDDNVPLRNLPEEEEEELQFDDPEEEGEVIDDDEEEEDEDDEVQVVTQSGP